MIAPRVLNCTIALTSRCARLRLSFATALLAISETLCFQVAQKVVRAHGRELTKDVARLGVGKRPLECWTAIKQELDMEASAQELVDASEPELLARYTYKCTIACVQCARQAIK